MIPLGALPPLVFDAPWVLVAAVLGPLLVFVLQGYAARRRAMRLRRLADETLLPALTGADRRDERGRTWRLALVVMGVAIACAGPRWGVAAGGMRLEGIDMVIAMDVSLSMMATDERPSRLERMKREVRRLRALAPSDRVALIAFAGRSYVLTPLTLDEGALSLYLDHLDPSIVGQGGSAMSQAIRQATDLLRGSDGLADRALVVLTDGETFEDDAPLREAAEGARDAGIRLVLVGFGTTQGATISMRDGETEVEKRDESGAIVVTRHMPTVMQRVATWADGVFIAADQADKAGRIREALRALRTARRTITQTEYVEPRHIWFLMPAWLLLAYDSWSLRRRRPTHAARAGGSVSAAVLLGVILSASSVASCREAPDPAVLFAEGRQEAAISAYRGQVAAGDSSARTLYNLGTALAGTDSLVEGFARLDAARRDGTGEVRARAHFNAGLAALTLAQAAPMGESAGRADDRRTYVAAAKEAYRAMLMTRPGYRDAQWNYELALRLESAQSGGGGGTTSPPPGETAPPRESPSRGSDLDRRQAEALLDNAAREEGLVQGRRVRTTRQPPVGRDW